MADVKTTITQEEFDRDWLTPAQALDALGSMNTNTKRREIARRLEGGLLRAMASVAVMRDRRHPLFYLRPRLWAHWPCIADVDFWESGGVTLREGQYAGIPNFTGAVEAFSVKFEPDGIRAIGPPPPNRGLFGTLAGGLRAEGPKAASVVAEMSSSPEAGRPDKPDTRPRVSDEKLRKWCDLYTALVLPAHDTLDNGVASAKAFFPGNSVGRDRVRTLLAGRKTGPKRATE